MILRLIFIFSLVLISSWAVANKMPWVGKEKYSLLSNNDSLKNVLTNFANNYDSPVFISEKITGNVNGHYSDVPPKEFLQKISDVHGINWYYDGSVLYFYRNDEIENKLIQLDHIKPSTLRYNLHSLGIWDHQYNWRELSSSGLIYLSGPPRMVEIITETAALMDARAKSQMESTYTLKIFPLKYASAYDRTITFRQQSMEVPGVVSMLKRLVSGESDNSSSLLESNAGTKKLKGKGLNKSQSPEESIAMGSSGEKATIEADIRSNSVVVYDLMSRMSLYGDLIDQLDQPVDQIEISVSIINIRTNKIEDLGISWRASSKNNGVIGFGDLPNGNEPNNGGIGLSFGANVSFSTVLSSSTNHVFSRLNMLAEEGEAQILSSPSVVSTDNMEAILDNSSTFHVRVAGKDEVDLFPISVGSVLKVTPHVIRDNESTSIHLEINIEDGQQTQERVDNIPTIQNSTISTRAIVEEDESLLIGGYHFDTMINSESRVPFLSAIPLIGSLFTRTHEEHTRMARLFLITPKLIDRKTRIDNTDKGLSTSNLDNTIRSAKCEEILKLKSTLEPNIIVPNYCKIEPIDKTQPTPEHGHEHEHLGYHQHDLGGRNE